MLFVAIDTSSPRIKPVPKLNISAKKQSTIKMYIFKWKHTAIRASPRDSDYKFVSLFLAHQAAKLQGI